MKTHALFFACCLASCAAAAQGRNQLATFRTGFGLKGGFSWADLQSTSNALLVSPFEYRDTFHAGAYYQRDLSRFASLQAEPLYARKGYQGDYLNRPAGTALLTNRLDYLELPLLLVGNLGNTFSLHLGPTLGLLLAAHRDAQALDLSRSSYQRLDVGGAVGAEARLSLARLGLRYTYSLSRLNPAGTATTTDGQPVRVLAAGNDYHNLVLQVYVGIGLAH